MSLNAPTNRKLRRGLVGGGQGSFIGRVHSIAAVMDHRAALVAGALSADPAKSKASALDYGIAPERAYGSYKEMVQGEKKLADNERIDFVSIATPNHTHFEIARAFAEAGFNVLCDKPLTFDLAQVLVFLFQPVNGGPDRLLPFGVFGRESPRQLLGAAEVGVAPEGG